MVWASDGLYQHYNAFIYFGSWCKDIIKSIFFDHNIVIPMWEWGLGYGSDIITTLNYYIFGDPFAFISVFVPAKYGEIGYTLSIILRFYAAGFAFCMFSRKMNCQKWTTVCGALMYTFCCYSIIAGVRHPYFMNPMIYLPLIFLGCEKILRKESPVPFIITVAISAFSNFYFLYMIVILTVIYVAIRLLSDAQYRSLKVLGKFILKFMGCGILGLSLAAIIFLPNVMNFLNNTRVNNNYTYNMLYYPKEYEALWGSFVSTDGAVYWAYTGMAPLAYFGAAAAFLKRRKKDLWARIYFIAEIIFLLLPVFGHIINGFGYVCNRWIFAWPLIASYMFAKSFPDLLKLDHKGKVKLSIGCAVYLLGCVLFEHSRTEETLVGCVFLMLSLFFVLFANDFKSVKLRKLKISKIRFQQATAFLLAIICIFQLTYYRYSIVEKDYLSTFHNKHTANIALKKERASSWNLINDNDFYRIDNSLNDNNQKNYMISSHQSTTTHYWSLINPGVINFLQHNSAYTEMPYLSKGLYSRSWLLPLTCSKYFVATNNKSSLASVPYGYEYCGKTQGKATGVNKKSKTASQYMLYKTNNSLPFGYTFDKIIPINEYEHMSVTQKQQAMLQGAVLDSDAAKKTKLDICNPSYSEVSIPYKVTCDKNTEFDGRTLKVKKSNALITINFDSADAGELYVLLSGFDFKSQPIYNISDDNSTAKKSKYKSALEEHDLKYWTPATFTSITAFCNKASTTVNHYTDLDIYAEGRSEYLLNLGYSEKPRTSIKLRFSQIGTYTLDNLSVISQPTDKIPDYVNNLKKDALENVKISTNNISGTITLDKAKLLCLSLPYSKGWTAYVDGKKTDLLNTNVMFSGIMLDKGTHNIELTYTTPYISLGLGISISAFVILIIIMFIRFYKRKKHQ